MKKKSARNIVITGATGDIAQAMIKRLPGDNLYLMSRSLPEPELPEKIDILVNNSGFGLFDNLTNLSDDQVDEMFKVNTLDAIKLTRKLKPTKLVNIASISAKLPTKKASVYAASKAALIVFGEALRFEGVNVLNVNTGPVSTKFHAARPDYLRKVGSYVLTADVVAEKIVKNLDTHKRELNLPWQLAFASKLRAIFPGLVDTMSQRFFNYK
ncbi:MAG: SDR family NAD(P)-dependent oxidoreductase [Streptococcaceae bacterium]|jgi:short-subunit dehydrogenase|nr:SDR family NAD(P)-dependent oxidoreductase [Streptococcaceae bacterium]